MRYLVLKVAAGVFLGVAAALGLYKLIEFWQASRALAISLQEQKSASEAHRAAVIKAAENLTTLTPDQLTALCGPPVKDHFFGNPTSGYGGISIEYFGADGHKVGIEFSCVKGQCFRSKMYRADHTIYDADDPAEYETFLTTEGKLHDRAVSQIEELPCLLPSRTPLE